MIETQNFAAARVPGTGVSPAMTAMSFGAGLTTGVPEPVTAPVAGAYDPARQITVDDGTPLALAAPGRTPFETKQGNQTWMDTER